MNDTAVSMTFKNKVTGLSKLERYEERLKSLQKIMNKMPSSIILDSGSNISNTLKSVEKVINDFNKKIISTNDNTKKLDNTTKKMNNTISTTFSVARVVAFAKTIERTVTSISKFTKYSSDYIENLNLMDVAFQGATNEARKFVNTLTEMYGLDESSLVRSVGLFKQLANAMGLSDEIGTNLSKTMTLMAIDISSLYNTSFERATSVLESSLAGQTKPIRGLTGADITETTLQVTLDSYGIDTTVKQLSYLEKRLLIVTSLINQLDEAQNDYGRTIESVANQSRVFDQQVQRLSRAIGNLFIPILSKVLPFLNGILMAMTEIINFIAGLLGFKEEDYDYFGATSDSVSDLTDNLNAAGSSAKKLRQGLRSFDKLNVISTPSASGIGAGGINPDLLNAANKAMEDYQANIEKVRMKANDVRDAILEWLGFTVETDEETGKLKIKFDHITGGTVLGALAVGGTIYNGVKKIYDFFSGISNFFVTGKGLSATVDGAKTLSTTKVAKDSILKVLGSKVLNFVQIAGGIGLVVDGMGRLSDSIKNAEEESSTLSAYLSFFETTLGGGIIGSKFGISGAAIGALLGAVTSTSYASLESIKIAQDGVYNIKYISDETRNSYEKIKPSIEKAYKSISKLNTTLKMDSKTKNEIIESVTNLVDQVKTKVEESKNNTIENINEMVKKGYMTPEEAEEAIKTTKTHYNDVVKENEKAQKRIEEILKTASNNKRDITKEERDEINSLYKQIESNTVSTLTDMSGEQTAIYEDLKRNKTKLSKEAASDVIKSALETRDKTIEAAEKEYKEVVGNAFKMKEAGIINEETYNKIVEDAETTKDKTITAANTQYDGIWDEFTTNQKDIANYIDKDTGNVKSNWDVFWDDMKTKVSDIDWKSIGINILKAIVNGMMPTPNTFSGWGDKLVKQIKKTLKIKSPSRLIIESKIGDYVTQGIEVGMDNETNKGFKKQISNMVDSINSSLNAVKPDVVMNYSTLIPASSTLFNNSANDINLKSNNIAQKQPFNPTFIIQVGDEEVARKVLNNLEDMASANGKPIMIGG